uniref:Uncharacterized protein n=1 Tax=Thermogemmatispora argillosa TaxID=2045280 RepID=A0A455T871_9CHLR|nr:hypothetical protein KTA_38380 [Thermogemmatispora argillosa]
MGILSSKAANPPIRPPSTQEFKVFPNHRTTAAPATSTNATAAALIGSVSFQQAEVLLSTGESMTKKEHDLPLKGHASLLKNPAWV